MTHLTCRLTAKNWDQLRNPMLGNRVWATVTIMYLWSSESWPTLAVFYWMLVCEMYVWHILRLWMQMTTPLHATPSDGVA